MTRPKIFKIAGILSCRPHLRKGEWTGNWQVDVPPRYSRNGLRERLSFDSRREAETAGLKILRDFELRARGEPTDNPIANATLEEIAELWMDEQWLRVRAGRKAESSLMTQAYHLKAALPFLGSTDISQITARTGLEYVVLRRGTGAKAPTTNSELATLRQVLIWAQSRGYLKTAPIFEKARVDDSFPDLPTPDEVRRMIETLPPEEGTLLQTFGETGARKDEILSLTWDNIDFETPAIVIWSGDDFTTKSIQSNRIVRVSLGLMKKLEQLPRSGRLVFPSSKTGQKRNDLRKLLLRAASNAEIMRNGEPMHITAKMFRKAHMSWLADNGFPEAALQKRVGHRLGSRVTAKAYIKPNKARDAEGVVDLNSNES